MLGEERLREILEGVLRDGQADALEGYLTVEDNRHTRLANAEVIQDVTVHDANLTVRACCDGKLGFATTNDLTPEGLVRVRRSATTMAKSRAGQPYPVGFLAPSADAPPAPRPDAYHTHTVTHTPEERHARLSGPLAMARERGLLMAGALHTGVAETALLNGLGLWRYHCGTRAEASCIALAGLSPGDPSGYAGAMAPSWDDLGLDDLASRAVDKAVRGRDPIEVPPGRYDVILEPAAVAELIEWMCYTGFSSVSVEEQTSFMAGRLGETLTGPHVTLIDDCTAPHVVSIPFDSEGTAKRRVVLIEGGVARAHVYDRVSAARAGQPSTGHSPGVGLGAFETGAVATNVHMSGGSDTPESLLARVDRGLWITRFHYVNGMLDTRRAVMTGLTRDGTFLIENGKLTRGVRNLRFTDSVLEAFARIEGLSGEREAVPTWWSYNGAVLAPTVLIRGLQFRS